MIPLFTSILGTSQEIFSAATARLSEWWRRANQASPLLTTSQWRTWLYLMHSSVSIVNLYPESWAISNWVNPHRRGAPWRLPLNCCILCRHLKCDHFHSLPEMMIIVCMIDTMILNISSLSHNSLCFTHHQLLPINHVQLYSWTFSLSASSWAVFSPQWMSRLKILLLLFWRTFQRFITFKLLCQAASVPYLKW